MLPRNSAPDPIKAFLNVQRPLSAICPGKFRSVKPDIQPVASIDCLSQIPGLGSIDASATLLIRDFQRLVKVPKDSPGSRDDVAYLDQILPKITPVHGIWGGINCSQKPILAMLHSNQYIDGLVMLRYHFQVYSKVVLGKPDTTRKAPSFRRDKICKVSSI